MQVCSVVAGNTAARASGMPFRPSVATRCSMLKARAKRSELTLEALQWGCWRCDASQALRV